MNGLGLDALFATSAATTAFLNGLFRRLEPILIRSQFMPLRIQFNLCAIVKSYYNYGAHQRRSGQVAVALAQYCVAECLPPARPFSAPAIRSL